MAEAHEVWEPLLLTHPRVYPFQEDLVLIITDDARLTLNIRTRERSAAPDVAAPSCGPIFECAGDVLVAASFSAFGYGFRTFKPVYQLGKACFYGEDYDPMQQLRAIWNAATDIDSSDQFAWMSGHEELAGPGMLEAMEVLLCLLGCGDRAASILSARALRALFRHAGHGCFSQTSRGLLRAGGKELRQAIETEREPEVVAVMRAALEEFESKEPWLRDRGS